MQKRLDKKAPKDRAYMEKMLTLFGVGSRDMAFVKRESIRNQFYFDLVTPLENQIAISDTQIYIFYAVKMGGIYLAMLAAALLMGKTVWLPVLIHAALDFAGTLI